MLSFYKVLPFLSLFAITISNSVSAQVSGCTDPLSTNYNPLAEINDGSCTYASQSIAPVSSILLSDTLQETSGLIQWSNQIWTHNDNTDTNLYAINEGNGTVRTIMALPEVENMDWEEVSQDEDHIYIGDFGNNSAGNRANLHILRILKSSLGATPEIDTIAFSYSNQQDFAPVAANTTNFDCESFIVSADSIYLFTKRWGDKKTFLYALAKTPGTHSAILRDSLNVQGLITGANYLEDEKLLVLCGYTSALQPFLYALYDFSDHKFFSGNKRKIGISLSYTQIEGITSNDGLTYYLSNERFVSGPANVPQKLHTFDLSAYFNPYLTAGLKEIKGAELLKVYPNPAREMIHFSVDQSILGKQYAIIDLAGKTISSGIILSQEMKIPVRNPGMYILQVEGMECTRFVVE